MQSVIKLQKLEELVEHCQVCPCNQCVSQMFRAGIADSLTCIAKALHILQGSNAQLRERMHELMSQLQASQAQAEALQGLQGSLQDAAGPSVDALVDAAVARERAAQDTRNKKVLELLNNKVSLGCTTWL